MGKQNFLHHTCSIIAFLCDFGAVVGFGRTLVTGEVPFEESWTWFGSLSPADAMHLYAMAFVGLTLLLIILNWNLCVAVWNMWRRREADRDEKLRAAAKRLASGTYDSQSTDWKKDRGYLARCNVDLKLMKNNGLAPLNEEDPIACVDYWKHVSGYLDIGFWEAREWHKIFHKYGDHIEL